MECRLGVSAFSQGIGLWQISPVFLPMQIEEGGSSTLAPLEVDLGNLWSLIQMVSLADSSKHAPGTRSKSLCNGFGFVGIR